MLFRSILNSENIDYPTLDKNIETDYLIVGAGLTGLHTAYLLAGQDKKITIIDADKVGYGSSGRNTGKITSSHGLIYDKISKKYGDEKAKLYYEANQKGVKLIEEIINEYDIDCNFEKLPNYIFTEDEDYVNQIKQEYNTCERLQITYEYLNDIYLKHPKHITVEQRYALLDSPTALLLLSRGDKATKEWSPQNIFEEKQNDTEIGRASCRERV